MWNEPRRNDPIHRVERENRVSFWAVSRCQHILSIEPVTEVFKNRSKLIIGEPLASARRMIVITDPLVMDTEV
jgi:hypothetical protein